MAKQPKAAKAPAIPEIYQGLDRSPAQTRLCIVEDTDGNFFKFKTPQENHIVAAGVQKLWPNYDAFHDNENEQTVLTYHENLFGANPPKEADKVTNSLMVWYKLCQTATDRTNQGTPKDPVTGRKSTIGNSKYYLGAEDHTKVLIKTPQAQACFKIFLETLNSDKASLETLDGKEVRFLTEAVLKQVVMDRAAELKTRQDPWRIFQYYRPTLQELHILRRC